MPNFDRKQLQESAPYVIFLFILAALIWIFFAASIWLNLPNFSLWLAFLLIFLLVVAGVNFALWRIIQSPKQENIAYSEVARSLQTALVPVWLGVLIIFIESVATRTPDALAKLADNLAIGGAALAISC